LNELLLGIDVGTTNVKAVLATPDGRVIAQASRAYPVHYLRPGWVEQDPADWWRCVCEIVRATVAEAGAQHGQVRAIGVSGQGCAVTLIDARGDVVRPAIIWMDSRSEAQCERLRECCAGEIAARNGKSPAPYNADPTLMWIAEHEPDSIRRAQVSLTATGYITYKLSGRPVANSSDASILFAFDLFTGIWSDDLIAQFGLPRRLYPEIAPCTEVIGRLTREAAAKCGLTPGIPIIAGGEDTSSAGLAMGVTAPGQALLSLGTAGTLYGVQTHPVTAPALLTFLHVLPAVALLGGSMVAVGAGLAWCKRLLGGTSDEALSELAAGVHPGAGGLVFLPYLSGELQPINDGNARGVFFGLGFGTEQSHLVRAVMEGAAFAIAHNLALATQHGTPITEIRAVGGPTRSPVWCQIIADVTGQPLLVMADNAGAPLGDALLAGAGVNLIHDLSQTAYRAASMTTQYVPDMETHARYSELFLIYAALYPALRTSFATLALWEAFA